ncbi:MAG: MarR family transcriptional regulator, partial [Candidatus Dormiibacterota bacterium]
MRVPSGRRLQRGESHLVVLLTRGALEYGVAIRRVLAERGFDDVPRSGSWVLATLFEAPTTVGELALRLSSTKQGLSRLSDALVERGYLRRSADPADHRLVRLALTARGRLAAEAVFAAVAEVDRSIVRRAG